MLKINLGLGRWQNAVAGDSMRRAREIMKITGCSISQGLKKSWREIKDFIKTLSISFSEFKQKEEIQKQEIKSKLYLKINKKVDSFEIIGADVEELMENMLEKIADVKGREFYNNFAGWFMQKYDEAIEILQCRNTYTFMDNIWCILDNGAQLKMF